MIKSFQDQKNDRRRVQRFVNMVELHEQQLSYVKFVT
jgi:hypothetical protein